MGPLLPAERVVKRTASIQIKGAHHYSRGGALPRRKLGNQQGRSAQLVASLERGKSKTFRSCFHLPSAKLPVAFDIYAAAPPAEMNLCF